MNLQLLPTDTIWQRAVKVGLCSGHGWATVAPDDAAGDPDTLCKLIKFYECAFNQRLAESLYAVSPDYIPAQADDARWWREAGDRIYYAEEGRSLSVVLEHGRTTVNNRVGMTDALSLGFGGRKWTAHYWFTATSLDDADIPNDRLARCVRIAPLVGPEFVERCREAMARLEAHSEVSDAAMALATDLLEVQP